MLEKKANRKAESIKPSYYYRFDEHDLGINVTGVLLSVLTLIGIWTRMIGLGDRPLALDEYYFVRSVQNILEFGVPRFTTGGYYHRGILLQYFTAASVMVFGDGNFAYRLPMALFNVGTLVMAYFLGRQFLNRSWSILLVALLTFSSWQIEMSRFARMYSAFQFFSVCFFWSLYRYSFNGETRKRYLAVGIAVLAILTHELGIFIALLLCIPFPAWAEGGSMRSFWNQRYYIAASAVVLGFGLFQAKFPFRYFGVADRLPADFVSPVLKAPNWLSFGGGLFGESVFIAFGSVAGLCLIVCYAAYAVQKRSKAKGEELLLGGMMVLALICAVFYQFAMSALILAVVLLREPAHLIKRPYKYVLALLALAVAFWFAMLFFNREWIETAGKGNMLRMYLRSIRLSFFGFPDLYTPVVRAWADSLPLLGAFLATGAAWQIILVRKASLALIVRNPIIPLIAIVIAFGIQPPLRGSTRYIFFLYPLVLCVGLISVTKLGEILKDRLVGRGAVAKLTWITLCVFGFAISEDFQPFHLAHGNVDTVAFRTGKYQRFEEHWYPRWDFQRPAEFLNGAASETSKVIVSSNVHTVNAYLNREGAVFWPWEDGRFAIVSREHGTRELWSNRRLLSTGENLRQYTANADNVWLVMLDHEGDPLRVDPETVWPGKVKNVEVFVPGRDKRIEVWKIELKSDGHGRNDGDGGLLSFGMH